MGNNKLEWGDNKLGWGDMIPNLKAALKSSRDSKNSFLTGIQDKGRRGLGLVIIIVGVFLSVRFLVDSSNPLPGIGYVGIATFLITLVGTYFMTENWDLNDGEFRKAITISVLLVFFLCMTYSEEIIINPTNTATILSSTATITETGAETATQTGTPTDIKTDTQKATQTDTKTDTQGDTITQTNFRQSLFTNFWAVVLAVIGFYSISRGLENLKGHKKD